MSRVEDDRQAQRATERLAQEKRLQESKAKQRQEGESAFSKLVRQQKAEQGQTQQQQGLAKSVLARATQQAGVSLRGQAQRGEAFRGALRQSGKAQDEGVQKARTGEGERLSEGRQTDMAHAGQASSGRQLDQGAARTQAESRLSDAQVTHEALDERGEALSKGSESAAGARAGRGKGRLAVDADGGGKQGGDGQGKKEGGAEFAAGFRFNPALMAPVPVARPKPKPTSGSERLRAIANEIAQKIVERVRVGTNAAGHAEFQIDLRGDVLSGLSIKLSAKNGKIQAVFSGSDRDVLKMLEAQRENLAQALSGRGLTLEDLRIEAKS